MAELSSGEPSKWRWNSLRIGVVTGARRCRNFGGRNFLKESNVRYIYTPCVFGTSNPSAVISTSIPSLTKSGIIPGSPNVLHSYNNMGSQRGRVAGREHEVAEGGYGLTSNEIFELIYKTTLSLR